MKSESNELTRNILSFWYKLRIFAYRQNSVGIFDQRKGIYRPAPKVGLPDTVAILPPNGRHCGVEVKVGKDKLRPEQVGALKNIELMGGIGIVAKTFPHFLSQIIPILEDMKIKIPDEYAEYRTQKRILS
jgi:hypothetical protein